MSYRLSSGGIFIDRNKPLNFQFNGRRMRGFSGDSLASAVMGEGQILLGRSFKYHRPRGVFAAGPDEMNALFTRGWGARMEPNTRATTAYLREGDLLRSQNHWPSLGFDLGAINKGLARFFPAGFYYKTFMWPASFWEKLFEPVIRKAAGLGPAPTEPDADRYEQTYAFCDLLVVGGGRAGLQAAREAAASGARVMLMEQNPDVLRRRRVDGTEIEGQEPEDWLADVLGDLAAAPQVQLRCNTVVTSLHDHGYLIAEETLAVDPASALAKKRLWRIRAKRVILASGATERPLTFANNDLPGVMLASAMRDYLRGYGVSPGYRVVIATNNEDAYETAQALLEAGCDVAGVIDTREDTISPLAQSLEERGVRVYPRAGIAFVRGRARINAVALCRQGGNGSVVDEIRCDAVAVSGGWSPNVHLWSQAGGKLFWCADRQMFCPDLAQPPRGPEGEAIVTPVGRAAGEGPWQAAGFVGTDLRMPRNPTEHLRAKAFVDFQNDVKLSDIELAAREGYTSVEHLKRYTTLGMANDQGKTSNINGLSALSQALDRPLNELGTTTFRPPFTPLTFGAIAGEARGPVFQPLRDLPLQSWHDRAGAVYGPVGQWRRAKAYLKGGETLDQAITREVLAARRGASLLDASSLGKILVEGPDAGIFLDRLYTNRMSTLGVGRCRYGLMCNEQGFVIDDGVAVRLGPQSYLVHTTSGGAARIHAWIEDWLQCEWPDLAVYVADLTEVYAQFAVAGPKARAILEALGGLDLSPEKLPHLGALEGKLAGHQVRVYRISYTGELSFEIAVPAREAEALWQKLLEAGAPHGITPLGTEALHILRAEKGYIAIGEETDGSVTPHDLNMPWLMAANKPDFIGQRGLMRADLARPDRWTLVGLRPLEDRFLPDGALAVTGALNAYGCPETEGRVTSAYHSPTLGRPIAMALVRSGATRRGEVLTFAMGAEPPLRAEIVDLAQYDPKGERLNG